VRKALASSRKELSMDYLLGAVSACLLFLYLLYALLKPEKF
jgi:K+-transporting ATPase KdpF subunit